MLRSQLHSILCLAVMAVLTCSSCSGYTKGFTGAVADSEVSRVKGYGVTIREVNAIPVPPTAQGIEVRGGMNVLRFTVDSANFNAGDPDSTLYRLEFKAEPPASYAVTAQRGMGRICAWPINAATGIPQFREPAGCATR